MLKKLFLVRHAQSKEDLDPSICDKTPEQKISLTNTGRKQVLELARILAPKINIYDKVKIITSPSARVNETMELFCSNFPSIGFEITFDSHIRNLDWGNVNKSTVKQIEKERYRVGVLYYHFPGGDSTPDFVRGVESFVAELCERGVSKDYPECTLIFTHGFSLRLIVKALLGISDEYFRFLANPPNCYLASLDFAESGKIIMPKPLPTINFKI